jgi:hypothetical protein
MTTGSFDALVSAVIAASVANTWSTAVGEWEVVQLEEDLTGHGVCVCGQNNLVKLFTIRNAKNGSTLYPIGSTCVNQFGRAELNRQVDLLSGLLTLRAAVRERRQIILTSDFFSRAMLEYFFFEGVFTSDQWNFGDGERDYDFLLKMFNKRNKEDISRAQNAKIYMLLTRKVLPFVEADLRLQ